MDAAYNRRMRPVHVLAVTHTFAGAVCVGALSLSWGGQPWTRVSMPPRTPYMSVDGFSAPLEPFGLSLPNWIPAAVAVGLALWAWGGGARPTLMRFAIFGGLFYTAAVAFRLITSMGSVYANGQFGVPLGGNGYVGLGLGLTFLSYMAMMTAILWFMQRQELPISIAA